MKKIAKIVVSLLVLLLLIGILVVGCLLYFFDPNKLKPILIDEVKKKTTYQVDIAGNLAWTLYPLLGVKAKEVSVTAPHEKQAFVELKDVTIEGELSQLWHRQKTWQGKVHIAAFRFQGAYLTDTEATVDWEPNQLVVSDLTANLYQGKLTGELKGQALASPQPLWEWQVQLNEVQLQPLLHDLGHRDTAFTLMGTGNLSHLGTTKGKTKEDMLKGLQGGAAFGVENGAVLGVDVNYLIQAADALINKRPLNAPSSAGQTNFDHLKGGFIIQNGVATTNDLILSSPTFTANGNGSLNLPLEQIDMHLQVRSQQALLTQWQIPMVVTGPFSKPEVKLDMSGLQKLITKQELDKIKDKANAIIKKHIPGEAGQFLQKLIR